MAAIALENARYCTRLPGGSRDLIFTAAASDQSAAKQ
jgi:hypothetical protein